MFLSVLSQRPSAKTRVSVQSCSLHFRRAWCACAWFGHEGRGHIIGMTHTVEGRAQWKSINVRASEPRDRTGLILHISLSTALRHTLYITLSHRPGVRHPYFLTPPRFLSPHNVEQAKPTVRLSHYRRPGDRFPGPRLLHISSASLSL